MAKSGISFSFSKTKEATSLQTSVICEADKTKEDDTEYFTSVVDKQIQSTRLKEVKKELVIPLITKNKWRGAKKPEDLENDGEPEKKKIRLTDEGQKAEGDSIESEAVKEILQEAEVERDRWESRDEEFGSDRTVPLLMQNAVPTGFETEDKLDVQLRPDEPEEADYGEVPIEEYGMALLRGMGFREDEGIGKNKQVFKPIEAVARPKGMGLGADKSKVTQVKQGVTSQGQGQGSRDEELVMKRGACAIVTGGAHRDRYAEVQGMDEDNNRALVKLALSGETISISQNALQLVTKAEYDKYSKYLNKTKTDRYNEEQQRKEEESRKQHKHSESETETTADNRDSHKLKHSKHKHSKHSREGRDRESTSDSKKDRDRSNGHSSKESSLDKAKRKTLRPEDIWLRSHLRVRIIDPDFKNGKYFKSKVVIEDVVSHNCCVVRTEDGRLLEDLSQEQLETVIPRSEPAYVMLLSGSHKHSVGEVIRKDKSACMATVQLLSDRGTVLETRYDTICEYTGDVSAEDDF